MIQYEWVGDWKNFCGVHILKAECVQAVVYVLIEQCLLDVCGERLLQCAE
jgi:hypothetical protein